MNLYEAMTISEHMMLERIAYFARGRGLISLVAALFLLLVLAIAGTPAPSIETTLGDASVEIAADRAWVLLPGQCVTIQWQIAEELRVSVNNQDVDNIGEIGYCPSLRPASPEFHLFSAIGDQQTLSLGIRYLPAELGRCSLLLAILVLFGLAIYFQVTVRLCAPIPFGIGQGMSLLALLLLCLLFQTGDMFRIELLLDGISRVFSSPAWHAFGLLLSGLILIPLVFQSLREGIKESRREDFVAFVSFLSFLLLLYLPFGFDSVGHWEEWVFRSYLESEQSGASPELVSRFWILVPKVLANIISSQSFFGYHLVNFLMFWGRLALFYGILRKLKMAPLHAFLTAILFMVYPVNTGLMSLRHFLMNARVLSLLAAVFFCLEFVENPSRLRLAGVWMALLLNVGSYEAGYAIIAVIPLLWWRRLRWTWKNVNITFIWYLFPVAKVVYLLLISLESRQFYGSTWVSNPQETQSFALDSIAFYAGIIESVYRQTFWYGWREALSLISQSAWIMPVIASLMLTGIVATILARGENTLWFSSRRQIAYASLAALLFVIPAVGVLMWLEKYNSDLRRMYIFVPAGASIAVFGLILMAASVIKHIQLRKAFIISLCLMAMFPALVRLYEQHAYFDRSANNKARILLQIVEQAPAIDANADVIILTEMLGTELRAKGVSEMRTGMLNSAIAVLYDHEGPNLTFVCIIDKRCFKDELGLLAFHLRDDTDFSDIVIFRLNEDLSVELLRELPPELGGASNASYKPDRLIDTSAPIPPRALTMLASARRD